MTCVYCRERARLRRDSCCAEGDEEGGGRVRRRHHFFQLAITWWMRLFLFVFSKWNFKSRPAPEKVSTTILNLQGPDEFTLCAPRIEAGFEPSQLSG